VIVILANISPYTVIRQDTHTQPFYGSMGLVRDNPGKPVSEKTFTHLHLSVWSAVQKVQ